MPGAARSAIDKLATFFIISSHLPSVIKPNLDCTFTLYFLSSSLIRHPRINPAERFGSLIKAGH